MHYDDEHRDEHEETRNEPGDDQQAEVSGGQGFTMPASEANAHEPVIAQEKRGITDLLYGVIARPVDTLRYVADNKLVFAGVLVYVAVAWISAVSSLPGTLSSANQAMPELSRLPLFDARAITFFTIFGTPVLALISLFFISGIFHLIAKLLKGDGDFAGLLSASGFAWFPTVLAAPFGLLGFLGGGIGDTLYSLVSFPFTIWALVLTVIAIRENYKFSTGRAVLTFFIPLLILFALLMVLVIGIIAIAVGVLTGR